MLQRIAWMLVALATVGLAQKFDGPRPPKKDIPYLREAANLIPTEAVQAREQGKKDEGDYVIEGASSPVVTPLAEPIFYMQADTIVPRDVELFKLETRGKRRELQTKHAHAIELEVTKVSGDGLWKLEVDETLEPGEYSLSPKDSNQAFCFQER